MQANPPPAQPARTDTRGPAVHERPQRVGFIQAQWHQELLAPLREGFLAAWSAAGLDREQVEVHAVPGVFELPLRCKQLALTGRYAALVAVGLITDGGIYRHDFVASSVNHGLIQVQLETAIPIVLAVMTPQNSLDDEASQRSLAEHLGSKGAEAAAVSLWALRAASRACAPMAATTRANTDPLGVDAATATLGG